MPGPIPYSMLVKQTKALQKIEAAEDLKRDKKKAKRIAKSRKKK